MSVSLYMDHHVPAPITRGLRRRGVDVLTAEQDGTKRLPDDHLLDRATALGRVLFTQDEDLLVEAALRQETGVPFAGVFYAHQDRSPVGRCVSDLEVLCLAGGSADFANLVEYIPLK